MADNLKFMLAILLAMAGVAGFYLLDQQPMVLRVLAVLAGLAAATAVGWFTTSGQRFVLFSQEAIIETKKVVWPTRKDTVQATLIVFAFVLAMAIMLWITDMSVQWLLYDLVLGWDQS